MHMTVSDKSAIPPQTVLSLASWAASNPQLHILVYDDADITAYVNKFAPESFLPDFHSLGTWVERADAWRCVRFDLAAPKPGHHCALQRYEHMQHPHYCICTGIAALMRHAGTWCCVCMGAFTQTVTLWPWPL